MDKIKDEVGHYYAGRKTFLEISNEAQEFVRHDMLVGRCGFEPTMIIRASGTAQPNCQAVLAKAQKLTTGNNAIPVRLILEENNKFDPDAIMVQIPTVLGKLGEWLAWEKAGYIPRGYCTGCGRNITSSILGQPNCPDCGNALFKDTQPTSELVLLNKYIKAKIIAQESMKVLAERIPQDKNFGKNSYGLSLAFKFEDKID